ncbi:sulfotransferase family 2 domain-containing protein [Bacillus toyonensis]|uniref:sulfotransferase family 2 domain-containing protein n=1 Tax=Bacillus toyonensis TaxID=155322 RepID=UPI000BF9A8D2|nr:sulfotransferase family 2 domain-containing protein [Bacillus toyonensis]PGC80398.1 hypothetical protein COM39_30415 [Bacillus toyonensis]
MVNTELIIFVHIAKTGGTTLRGVLDKQYGSDSLFMYTHKTIESLSNKEQILTTLQNHITNVKAISGHFAFGMKYAEIDEPLLPLIQIGRKITYVSMIRRPVDRIFSLYHHYKRNNWLHSELTFKNFITHKLYDLNHQTHYISGTLAPNLDIAKTNIMNHFALVGVTDMYKESLFLMKKRFNWTNFKYDKLGVFVKPSLIPDIPNKLIESINNDNHLDLELYKFTRKLLKKKIKLLSKSQRKELRYFSPFY